MNDFRYQGGVLHAASQERPDSLAGIISTIARGATDPLQLLTSADSTDRLLDATEALVITAVMIVLFLGEHGWRASLGNVGCQQVGSALLS